MVGTSGRKTYRLSGVMVCVGVICLAAGLAQRAEGNPFNVGNLVVVRTSTTSNAAQSAFLDEYTTSAGTNQVPVQTIALPVSSGGGQLACTLSGTATSEGFLHLTPDGKYLVVAGYNAVPGTASITSSNASTINRTLARISAFGTIDTSTGLADNSNLGNPRSVISNDGSQFWVGTSAAGIRYITFGTVASSTQISTTITNTRVVNIFSAQLYVSSASGVIQGVATVGTGLPTTSGQTITILPGFPTATGPSNYDYFFADPNTVYVCDDRTIANGGGLQKWVLNAGTWSLKYTLNSALTNGLRGIAGKTAGANASLFVTTADSLSNIMTVTDVIANTNNTGLPSFSLVATVGTGKAFRGIAFTPASADCDTNGTPDSSDIAAHPQRDCNTDSTLDVCELSGHDCNSNGQVDACDIAGATASPDCDSNGVIDTCELGLHDCNSNNTVDACDVLHGAADCNSNHTPDACEVATHDCNTNGSLDACETGFADCDTNGTADACEISAGSAGDCNSNFTKDICELGANDANSNGVLDACEPGIAAPQAFGIGNLVVVQFGADGASDQLGAQACPTYLREYKTDGTYVQRILMPTVPSGQNRRFTNGGFSISEGQLNRSTDRRYLELGGYNAAVNTAGVSGSGSSTVNRVVGRVASNAAIDTETSLNVFSGASIRGAASVDGSAFWIVGSNNGVQYATFASTNTTDASTGSPANIRTIEIYNDAQNGNTPQLFIGSGAAGFIGISRVGVGLQTSGAVTTLLPGFSTATSATLSPYGFYLADAHNLYICDDNVNGLTGHTQNPGIQKWRFSDANSNWSLLYTLTPPTGRGIRQMTQSVSGSTVTIFCTEADDLYTGSQHIPSNAVNHLYSVQDLIPGDSPTGTFTTLATSTPNTIFRGVAFAPVLDCNTNNTQDLVEIAGNPGLDCNTNGVIDLCELTTDCDTNGILDACETDANTNGTPDACEAVTCTTCGGDINGDNSVDGEDVAGWVRCGLGAALPADKCACSSGMTLSQFVNKLLTDPNTACP